MKHLIRKLILVLEEVVTALDNLNNNIAELTTAVDNATAAGIGNSGGATGVPEADVQTAADNVAAQTARLVAATPATPAPVTTEPVIDPVTGLPVETPPAASTEPVAGAPATAEEIAAARSGQ